MASLLPTGRISIRLSAPCHTNNGRSLQISVTSPGGLFAGAIAQRSPLPPVVPLLVGGSLSLASQSPRTTSHVFQVLEVLVPCPVGGELSFWAIELIDRNSVGLLEGTAARADCCRGETSAIARKAGRVLMSLATGMSPYLCEENIRPKGGRWEEPG